MAEKRKPTIKKTISQSPSTPTLSCYCRRCMTTKSASQFYQAVNEELDKNGFMSICKKCCESIYSRLYENYQDVDRSIYESCKIIDLVYSEEAVKMALNHYTNLVKRQTQDAESVVFAYYNSKVRTTAVKNGDVYGLRFVDSDKFIYKLEKEVNNLEENKIKTPDEKKKELEKMWGKVSGREDWEYEYLENELTLIQASYECKSYTMLMIMKDICYFNLKIEKERQADNDVSKLIKSRQDLLNDARLKPVQSIGLEADETVTFGTLIDKWENERPIPKRVDKEMLDAINYSIGQLARMEGISNPLTDAMMKELEEYSVNSQDIEPDIEEDDLEVDDV